MINLQNIDDNEWYLVRYLHPGDYNPRRLTKADEDFAKKLKFKDIPFSVKSRDIYLNWKNSFGVSDFGYK